MRAFPLTVARQHFASVFHVSVLRHWFGISALPVNVFARQCCTCEHQGCLLDRSVGSQEHYRYCYQPSAHLLNDLAQFPDLGKILLSAPTFGVRHPHIAMIDASRALRKRWCTHIFAPYIKYSTAHRNSSPPHIFKWAPNEDIQDI